MKKIRYIIKDAVITFVVIIVAFLINVLIKSFFETNAQITMVFVLGVLIISLKTQGYFWGVFASLFSVIAVNFAFTYPYYAINFHLPESIYSAVVMLIVAIATSALTTKIKTQEKMRRESEHEKMRANLLRAISHDLRTPLTSIYGSTSAIIENYDSLSRTQQLKLLEDVRQDSQWLIRMVENLLSVTRIDEQKVQVIKTPTVLEELIDSALIAFAKRYPQQNVEVSIPDDFISIPMDPMLIEQVIINILENAVLHAHGMSKLKLSVVISGDEAIFSISDDGCGIPKEKIDDLFNGYYYSADTPSDGKRSSMGIGLSVCSTIIKAHGGTISAENRRKGGAVFSFILRMGES